MSSITSNRLVCFYSSWYFCILETDEATYIIETSILLIRGDAQYIMYMCEYVYVRMHMFSCMQVNSAYTEQN